VLVEVVDGHPEVLFGTLEKNEVIDLVFLVHKLKSLLPVERLRWDSEAGRTVNWIWKPIRSSQRAAGAKRCLGGPVVPALVQVSLAGRLPRRGFDGRRRFLDRW
jgi:hypothetical protein